MVRSSEVKYPESTPLGIYCIVPKRVIFPILWQLRYPIIDTKISLFAQNMIYYMLRYHHKGRCTFLTITVVKQI